jgi:aminoglycoside 6'-N-acetyltransferase
MTAELRGERVVLRPLRRDDVPRLIEIQSEPSVARWWGPPDRDELLRQADGAGDSVGLAVETEDGLIGLIQYYEEDDPGYRHAGIDVFVAASVQGRGLGTEAVRVLAHHLVRDRGHHRLIIDPTADNLPAIRSYEKVGFRAVGVMREYWRAPDGTWRDGLLMDLLAGELGDEGAVPRGSPSSTGS